MTTKYHINNKDHIRPCGAQPGNCRFSSEKHFDSLSEAVRALEQPENTVPSAITKSTDKNYDRKTDGSPEQGVNGHNWRDNYYNGTKQETAEALEFAMAFIEKDLASPNPRFHKSEYLIAKTSRNDLGDVSKGSDLPALMPKSVGRLFQKIKAVQEGY